MSNNISNGSDTLPLPFEFLMERKINHIKMYISKYKSMSEVISGSDESYKNHRYVITNESKDDTILGRFWVSIRDAKQDEYWGFIARFRNLIDAINFTSEKERNDSVYGVLTVDKMCKQSLDDSMYSKWKSIVAELENQRKDLNYNPFFYVISGYEEIDILQFMIDQRLERVDSDLEKGKDDQGSLDNIKQEKEILGRWENDLKYITGEKTW